MGLHVVAEGVEAPAQAEELLALGCSAAQGWLFAPAMPADDVPGFVVASRRRQPVRRPAARRREPAPAPERERAQSSLVLELMSQIGITVEGT
jgi:predicted signal transduction protein with EAL and GGDEF domain